MSERGGEVIKPFVDLHVHSFYSDGNMSPEEIVEAAVSNNVGVLAITDHNVLEGSIIAGELCAQNGIHYIQGVELDTVTNGKLQHILAYGFDINNKAFTDFVGHMRFLLDESSVKLVELMQCDYADISLTDFFEFVYDKRLGGWKMLHYLVERGVTSSLKEGMQIYSDYGIVLDNSGFSSIAATALRIKQAGGFSVLAHPGEMIDASDISKFKSELRHIISNGIDGIECYYPSHSAVVTQACLDVCNESGLIITAGSDCHGDFFVNTRVGEMNIDLNKLVLKDLIPNDITTTQNAYQAD